MSQTMLSVQPASPVRCNEDGVSVVIGLGIVALALLSLIDLDALGWIARTSVWANPAAAIAPVSGKYSFMGGLGALAITYCALRVVLCAGVYALGDEARPFASAFTAVFAIAFACWFVGSWAHFAPADQAGNGISGSLRLASGGGFIVALAAGLMIANLFPAFAERLNSALRPDFYARIAIVILGAVIAVKAAGWVTQSLSQAGATAEGIYDSPGWVLGATAKVFAGLSAFVFLCIWMDSSGRARAGRSIGMIGTLRSPPKYAIGFVATFLVAVTLALGTGPGAADKLEAAIGEADVLRVIFLTLTCFSIGALSNFRALRQAAPGKFTPPRLAPKAPNAS
jgi:hypothetical protein